MDNKEILERLAGFGDIKLEVKAILGTVKMPIGSFLKLTRGSIVSLDKNKNALLDIVVNNNKVAEGQIRITENERIAIEIDKVSIPKKF